MTCSRTAALATLCLALSATAAQPAEPSHLTSRVTAASLFKNGLALVIREATVPGAGEYLVTDLPAPVHGSFWVIPPKGVELTAAVALKRDRPKTAEAAEMMDLFRANIGREVEIQTEDGWTKATIRKVSDEKGFILVEGEGGMWAIAPHRVYGIRAPELATERQASEPGAALRLALSGGGVVRLQYLAFGLTWAPSYRVDVLDDTTALLTMKAQVLNDIETLEGARLDLITGYPNIRLSEVVDPVAMAGDVRQFIASLGRRPGSMGGRGAMAQQMLAGNVAYVVDAPVEMRPAPGEQAEDLFFYPCENVTLARGERGYYPLFGTKIACQSIHTWDVGSSLDERGRLRGSGDEGGATPPVVWHTLRLTNPGEVPWTTAPAMTLREGRVLGQDILRYTGAGQKTELKVTLAVDVPADQRETEVERQRQAATFYGSRYDLVTVKGELRIWNRKDEDILIRITKRPLEGELVSSTPTATTRTMAESLRAVNPRQELRWEIPIKANDKAYLTYVYKVYVRS